MAPTASRSLPPRPASAARACGWLSRWAWPSPAATPTPATPTRRPPAALPARWTAAPGSSTTATSQRSSTPAPTTSRAPPRRPIGSPPRAATGMPGPPTPLAPTAPSSPPPTTPSLLSSFPASRPVPVALSSATSCHAGQGSASSLPARCCQTGEGRAAQLAGVPIRRRLPSGSRRAISRPRRLLHGHAELGPDGIDITDAQVDEGVRTDITGVFGQEQPRGSTRDRHERRQAWLEAVLSLLGEPQARIPGDRGGGVGDVKDRDGFLVHATTTARTKDRPSSPRA